jgi:hypothetical protein
MQGRVFRLFGGHLRFIFPTEWAASLPGVMKGRGFHIFGGSFALSFLHSRWPHFQGWCGGGCFASLGVVCIYLSYRVGALTSRGDVGEGVSLLWVSFAFIFPIEWVASLPGGGKWRVFCLFGGRLRLPFLQSGWPPGGSYRICCFPSVRAGSNFYPRHGHRVWTVQNVWKETGEGSSLRGKAGQSYFVR